MVYEKTIIGRFVDMRSITLEDAEFSYSIRSEEKNRHTVGHPAATVEEQRKFIEWQMKQPGDYYFVVTNKKGKRVGLIGVYNIIGDTAEIGREVSDGNPMEAMEAEVLLADFYRDYLNLKTVYSVIYLNNKKHLSNQKKIGFQSQKIVERNGVACAYYEFDVNGNYLDKIRRLLAKIEVNEIE